MAEKIRVKYFVEGLHSLEKIGKGNWIDLRAAKTMDLQAGQFALIPLGVGMILPDGYEAHIAPRSSTYKRWGLLQTNGVGIVDNSYNGENDQWMMPVFATTNIRINKNDRICQFRIVRNMPDLIIEEVDHLNEESRDGFGSTGSN